MKEENGGGARIDALTVFMHVGPELDLNEFRPVKQVHLARILGTSQQNISRILESLALRSVLERGPDEGASSTYRINPGYPGVQALINRR